MNESCKASAHGGITKEGPRGKQVRGLIGVKLIVDASVATSPLATALFRF